VYTFKHCSNSLTPAAVLPEPETSYNIDVLRLNVEWTGAAVGPRYRATMQRREEERCDISSSSSSSSSRSPPSRREAGGGGVAGECTLTVKRYLSHLAQAHLQRSLPPSRPPVSSRKELQGCRPAAAASAAAATVLTMPSSCTPSRLPHAHTVRPRCNAAAAAALNPPAAAAAAAALARLPVAERLQLVVAELPVSVHSP